MLTGHIEKLIVVLSLMFMMTDGQIAASANQHPFRVGMNERRGYPSSTEIEELLAKPCAEMAHKELIEAKKMLEDEEFNRVIKQHRKTVCCGHCNALSLKIVACAIPAFVGIFSPEIETWVGMREAETCSLDEHAELKYVGCGFCLFLAGTAYVWKSINPNVADLVAKRAEIKKALKEHQV